jgi:drug/metabolite transporter (DMT)-like permease
VPFLTIALLLVAATCHASWNLLAKRTSGSRDFLFTCSMLVGALIFSPAIILGKTVLWLAVLSALAETVYFLLLARAYERFDLSVVYPIGRGSAPVLTAIVSVLWFGERLSPLGVAGIVLIAIGIAICTMQSGRFGLHALLISLAVGASISTYTLIDGRAARIADPFAYTATVFAIAALMMLALHGRRAKLRELRTNALPIVAIGVLMLVAYGLVVGAYKLSGVAYAAAVREVSIPLAAIAGRVFLGEPFGKARIGGSIVVAGGIALIALAK